jgi:hypothetical protein
VDRQFRQITATLLVGGSLLSVGCATDSSPGPDGELGVAAEASIVHIGNISQSGMQVNFDDITNPVGLTLSKTVGLAACSEHTLYAVQNDGGSPVQYSLYFSHDAGLTWTKSANAGKGPEIACDRAALYTMDATKTIYTAQANGLGLVKNSGDFDSWRTDSTSPLMDHIQGGNGTVYGVQYGTGTSRSLYTSSLWGGISWGAPIATIGANMVTGSGAAATVDLVAVPRRAYTVEPNGTVSMNDTILAGQNTWTSLNTGSERYTVLAAASANTLFALQTKADGPHLNRVTMSETNCTDGLDNDGNGLIDAEEPGCRQSIANTWCAPAARANGDYCYDRFTPIVGTLPYTRRFDAGRVHCAGHVATLLETGVCVHNANSNITNADTLMSWVDVIQPEPANTGHWCSVLWKSTGQWDFKWSAGASDPCVDISNADGLGGTITRAGLYSTTGNNRVLATCTGISPRAGENVGASALQGTKDSVPAGTLGCVFNVAERNLPLFQAPFPSWAATPSPSGFDHVVGAPVDLAQFGNGQTGLASHVDTQGFKDSTVAPVRTLFERSYDYGMAEGTPLYALNYGVVYAGGARERDIHKNGGSGTAFQGELFIKYDVGLSSWYRESFIVAYAHVRRMLVKAGDTVKPGQIVAYSGTTGASGGPHLDMGAARLSNTNAWTASEPEFGYHNVYFQLVADWDTNSSGSNESGANNMDLYGWSAPTGTDPWTVGGLTTAAGGASPAFNGLGCWSINLWKSGAAPAYP